MYTFDRLPGAARGYKQPGKKLRPRDAYVAYLTSPSGGGFHSTREAMRAQAGEVAAYGGRPYSPFAHVARTLSLMPARQRRRVERALDSIEQRGFRPHLPRGQRRVLDAMLRANTAAECMAADAQLLRNAY